jgi:hypothetical protein
VAAAENNRWADIIMAWAKGRQERESYKAKCLAVDPSLVCNRRASGSLSGFVVSRGKRGIGSARAAEDAWYDAWLFLQRESAQHGNEDRPATLPESRDESE